MGPKKTIDRPYRLTVRIPADLAEQIRAAASERGETVTQIVERALRRELERMGRGE